MLVKNDEAVGDVGDGGDDDGDEGVRRERPQPGAGSWYSGSQRLHSLQS